MDRRNPLTTDLNETEHLFMLLPDQTELSVLITDLEASITTIQENMDFLTEELVRARVLLRAMQDSVDKNEVGLENEVADYHVWLRRFSPLRWKRSGAERIPQRTQKEPTNA